MNRLLAALILVLLVTPVYGQDFDKGREAYKSGDYAVALRSLRPLAEQGERHAQYLLGRLHGQGLGGPRDYIQAYKWLSLSASRWPAAMKDQAPSIMDRNKISKKMNPAQIARAEELVREWMPGKLRAKDQSGASGKKDFDNGVSRGSV